MIFTLFAMSLVPTVGLLQILRIEAYYTFPWVSKHTAQKTELAERTPPSRTGVSKIASWSSFRDAMDTTSSPAPEKNLLPKTNLLPQHVPLAPRQPLPGEGFLTTRQSSNQERDSTNRSGSCCTIRGREGRTRDLFPTRSTGPCRVGP